MIAASKTPSRIPPFAPSPTMPEMMCFVMPRWQVEVHQVSDALLPSASIGDRHGICILETSVTRFLGGLLLGFGGLIIARRGGVAARGGSRSRSRGVVGEEGLGLGDTRAWYGDARSLLRIGYGFGESRRLGRHCRKAVNDVIAAVDRVVYGVQGRRIAVQWRQKSCKRACRARAVYNEGCW